ncbi:hypothetical protein HIM_00141 [Hirsutella minnesotensis 3608]|nr:hypothetical protein HIM_00141 [Hirsutella minnesotensis 3608]
MDGMALPASCQSAGCHNISSWFKLSMSPKFQNFDKCFDRGEISCGGFNEVHGNNVLPHRHRISPQTLIRDEVDNIVLDLLQKPYAEVSQTLAGGEFKLNGSPAVDEANRQLVADYYRSCIDAKDGIEADGTAAFLQLMDEVHRSFARLDVVEESNYVIKNVSGIFSDQSQVYVEDSSDTMWERDWDMFSEANANLARIGIFPLVEISVRESLLYPNKTAVVLSPFYEPVTFDYWRWETRWYREFYRVVMSDFLREAHASHLDKVQHFDKIPRRLMSFEWSLQQKLFRGRRREMQFIKKNVREVVVHDLAIIAPHLGLDKTIVSFGSHYNKTVRTVEVVQPNLIAAIDKLAADQSRETIRSWLLLQAYLQTVDLWEMKWAKRWVHWSAKIHGVANNQTHEERCLTRAQKHFGHVLDSLYIRKEYSSRTTKAVAGLAETIRQQWLRTIAKTTWMTGAGLNFTLAKMQGVKISIGFPQAPDLLKPETIAQHYAGAEVHVGRRDTSELEANVNATSTLQKPHAWKHLHDYFNLERWRITKSWKRVDERLAGHDEWHVKAYSGEIVYSLTKNQLLIPAGALRQPLHSPDAPAWYAYAGLGTSIAREVMRSIDGIGRQYQANGSIVGDTWGELDWRKYTRKLTCFWWRWRDDASEPAHPFSNGLDKMWEGITREQAGTEVSWYAYKAATANQTELSLPGLESMSIPSLYWTARTMPFCSVMPQSGHNYLEAEKSLGPLPPYWKRRDEPLLDSAPYQESLGCGCARCSLEQCHVYGELALDEDVDDD